jgi:hypothetical protein
VTSSIQTEQNKKRGMKSQKFSKFHKEKNR